MNEVLLHKAIEFAAIKHYGQKRKGTDTPYIVHPMEVYGILAISGCSNETMIAGILHDVVEDTDSSIDEVTALFGEKVAKLVADETEDKSKTWQQRKEATINDIITAPIETKQICCADKLSNLLSMYLDYQKCGEQLWERFSAPKTRIEWYYRELINSLSSLGDFEPYVLMKKYFNELFSNYSKTV